MSDATCTFCDLVNGAGEVSVCYEDADAIAFMDVQPVNTGHVLVVPRRHCESLADTPRELALHLFDVALRLEPAIRQACGCAAMNIVVNSGSEAGQDELHYHVHLIPRKADDGFDIPLPFAGSEVPDRTRLDATAARIGSLLRDPMRTAGAGAGAGGSGETKSTPRRTVERVVERGLAREGVAPAVPRAASADREEAIAWRAAAREGAHGELLTD